MTSAAAPRSLRVALLDNTINASYIFAKILRRKGYDAELIQQPGMPFNHQPVWEDADLAWPASELFPHGPGDRWWLDLERTVGWRRPAWVRRPRRRLSDVAGALPHASALARAMPAALVPFALALAVATAPAIAALRAYDAVLVVGPSAGTAYLAGRPYAVITMGWDVFTLPFMTASRSPLRKARAYLQRAALRSSVRILGLPAMDLDALERLGLAGHFSAFPVPVDVDGYDAIPPSSRAGVFGAELAARVEGRVVYFCPSRISFAEKGQDILLRAFAGVRARGVPASLVLLGWGHEADEARALIAALGIGEDVHVLPVVFSKPRLINAFRVTDVAPVQFVLGGYGGVTREALAAGAPVIASYDPDAAQPHPPDDPAPIVSASTVESLRDAMIRLADPAQRRPLGERGREWARRNHQERPVREIGGLLGGLV